MDWFERAFQAGAAILAILFLIVIIHAKRGSGYTFVYKISGLLLICDLGLIPSFASNLWIYTVCGMVSVATFSVAHWMLAHKYHQVATETPFVVEEEPIPHGKCLRKKAINWIILILNAVTGLG